MPQQEGVGEFLDGLPQSSFTVSRGSIHRGSGRKAIYRASLSSRPAVERYVNDISCVWDGSHESPEHFLTLLNSFYPILQFTFEVDGSSMLCLGPYLRKPFKAFPVNFNDLLPWNLEGTLSFSLIYG